MSDIEHDTYVHPGARYDRSGAIIGYGQGMTLRDAAALAAMQAILTSDALRSALFGIAEGQEGDLETAIAAASWQMADAFVAARKTGDE